MAGQRPRPGRAPPPAARTAGPGGRRRPGRSRAPGPAARRRSGSPEVSVRSTRVLTKKPTSSSSAGVGAAGDRGAERDVVAGAEPGQQRRQRRLQHHEQAGPAGPGQLQQPAVQPGVEGEAERVAAMAGTGPAAAGPPAGPAPPAARPAPGASRRAAGDQAVRVGLVAEQRALPQGVVGILHRQRCPARRPAPSRRGIGPAQVVPAAVSATSRRRRCGAAAAAGRARSRPGRNSLARSGSSPARSKPMPGRAIERRGELASPVSATSSTGRASARMRCTGAGLAVDGEQGAQALVPADQVGESGFERRRRRAARSAARTSGML